MLRHENLPNPIDSRSILFSASGGRSICLVWIERTLVQNCKDWPATLLPQPTRRSRDFAGGWPVNHDTRPVLAECLGYWEERFRQRRCGHRSISYVPLPRIVEHKECIHVRSCRLAATFPPIVATYGYPLLFEGGFAAGFRLQGSGKVVDMGRGGGGEGQNAQHTIIHAWKAGF